MMICNGSQSGECHLKGKKLLLLIIVLVGGILVLGSYVWGFQSRPEAGNVLWGGVPESIQPYYTLGMVAGALGYFFYTYFLLFALDESTARVGTRWGYGIFPWLYLIILIPSALWLPLSYLATDQAGTFWVWLVRFDLLLVALGSIGLLIALLNVNPKVPRLAHQLAVAGIILFSLQTVLLDAVIWGISFK